MFAEGSLPERHTLVLKKGQFLVRCSPKAAPGAPFPGFKEGSVFYVFVFFGLTWYSECIFLMFEPCKTESDFLLAIFSYTKSLVFACSPLLGHVGALPH